MKRAKVVLLHYTSPSVIGGVEQVMGVHATALREVGAEVTVIAGRGRAAPRGVRLARVPEVSSTHPAVLRDLRSLARGSVTAEHAALVHPPPRGGGGPRPGRGGGGGGSQLAALSKMDRARVTVVPNGIDLAERLGLSA